MTRTFTYEHVLTRVNWNVGADMDIPIYQNNVDESMTSINEKPTVQWMAARANKNNKSEFLEFLSRTGKVNAWR